MNPNSEAIKNIHDIVIDIALQNRDKLIAKHEQTTNNKQQLHFTGG